MSVHFSRYFLQINSHWTAFILIIAFSLCSHVHLNSFVFAIHSSFPWLVVGLRQESLVSVQDFPSMSTTCDFFILDFAVATFSIADFQ